MLFAAGLITGEALMGILMAIPIVVTEQRATCSRCRRDCRSADRSASGWDWCCSAPVGGWMYRVGKSGDKVA